jgi:hypothetical protein
MKTLRILLLALVSMSILSCAANHDLISTSDWLSKKTCSIDPNCTITAIHSHINF